MPADRLGSDKAWFGEGTGAGSGSRGKGKGA
ncbi:MAG: hypothetical protein QOG64_1472 [Acidimicrobiaceae bacterium]|nr:hypothetical protein [Acidimicrobiaceae bacterium]